MARIAAIDGGAFYHRESLTGARYRDFFDTLIYVRDLPSADLSPYDAVIATDRVHPRLLASSSAQFQAYLDRGGTVVAMGETRPDLWLPRVRWTYRPTNFWWWLDPQASLGLTAATPEHPLFRDLTLADATWHYHGVFHPPDGAVPVIGLAREDGVLLYDDRVSTRGRMIVTSLDPFYHHGSHFMPATTRFLDRFLPWLQRELDGETGGALA